MLGFFKRKEKRRDTIPPWVKWAVAMFILYAMFTTNHRERTQPVANLSEVANSEKTGEAVSAVGSGFRQFKNKILPSSLSFKVDELAPGTGHPAICGQEATIAYTARIIDGEAIGDRADKDKPFHLHIGSGKAMPALEQGVVGLSPGGKRRVAARYELTYGSNPDRARKDVPKGSDVSFDIELLSVSPSLAALETAPFRIMEIAPGSGRMLLCGFPAKAQVTVWNVEGKKLYESREPLAFTPGKAEVFLGLEQGILGLRVGGARTMVVPPAFQKTLSGGKPKIAIPLPPNQAAIVDVSAVP